MHNDHYTKLAEYEPFKVYEAWARGNEELFKKHFTFGGYYLAALKYLARIESKDDPVKNLEKVAVYVQAMINILKKNHNLDEFIQFTDTISNLNPAEILAKLRSMEEIVAEKGWVVETNEDGQRIITSPPTTQFPHQPSPDCRQLEEWHDWKDEDNQPEKGRWIEWDGQKYEAEGYEGKKQATFFREDDGNYTSYLWHVGYESPIKGYWGWEEIKNWGKWRYVDAPS